MLVHLLAPAAQQFQQRRATKGDSEVIEAGELPIQHLQVRFEHSHGFYIDLCPRSNEPNLLK